MKQEKQVNICKNFTDTIAFVAAVFGIIAVLLAKDAFKPTETVTSFMQVADTKAYFKVAIAFLLSGLLSVFTRRLPPIALPFSIVPGWIAFYFYDCDIIVKRPMVYIFLGLIHFAGNIIYVGQWFADSRENEKNVKISYISAFANAALAAIVWGFSHFKLSLEWRLTLEKPIIFVAFLGAICGACGLFWFIKQPIKDRKTPPLLCCVISVVLCIVIFYLRSHFADMGI